MADRAAELGLEVLVEVRSEAELEDAVAIDGAVIGVNSRDLETLEVDVAVVERLIPQVPGVVIAIAESGVRDRADVERAARVGADAVLVGSVLSAAGEAAITVRTLARVTRRDR
jgi:indole-3-glycerol phosphate synthase